MPMIKFIKNKPAFEVPEGADLMAALTEKGLPVASSCGGDGVCCKCVLKIIEGEHNLSSPNETELFLREQFNLAKNIRVSCQTKVLGDVTVDANYW